MNRESVDRVRNGGRLSRSDWLAFGLKMLGAKGPGAIRLDAMCSAMGVTKGSFYWHFASRSEFLDSLLVQWEERETHKIIERVEARGGSPRDRIEALYWEAQSGHVDFTTELAIRHWARQSAAVADAVKRVDAERIDYMERLLREAGLEAGALDVAVTLLYGVILGEGLAYRAEDPAHRHRRLERALQRLLDPAAEGGPHARSGR